MRYKIGVLAVLLPAILSAGDIPPSGIAGGASWAKSSTINLYVVSPTSGGFTAGQITDINTSFDNWNSTLGSSLTFSHSTVTTAPSSPSGLYIIVQLGTCAAGLSACTSYFNNSTSGYATYSIINVVSSAIGTNAILPLMAHEVGHTYLLADCNMCNVDDTLMSTVVITPSSHTSPRCGDELRLYSMTVFSPAGSYGSVSCP